MWGMASTGEGGCWGRFWDSMRDQGSGPSGLHAGPGIRALRPAGPQGCPHSSAPALSLGVLLQSQEVALEAVDCALQIRVPSRENRDVYTEHSYPNGHVIIRGWRLLDKALPMTSSSSRVQAPTVALTPVPFPATSVGLSCSLKSP